LTKVIIVSPPEIHDYFTSSYDEWDTQVPVASIEDMWNGLQNGTLSIDSEIVIFTDAYVADRAGEIDALSTAIATFASEALVLTLLYDVNNLDTISAYVNQKVTEQNLPIGRFFPIDTAGDIGNEIYEAYVAYAQGQEGGILTAAAVIEEPAYEEPVVEEYAAPIATPGAVEALNTPLNGYQEPASRVTAESGNLDAFAPKRGLVVASTSSKGGSGKTTVALCTASMVYHASRLASEQGLREKPLSVCIVDMDTRDGQIGFLLGQSVPTALNIFVSEDKSIETIQKNLIYDERLGIHALLAPKRARTADYLTPEFYQDLIQKLRSMFDVVVLDTSVNYLDALLGKVVLPISDAVMFVTNLSVGSVYGMNRWMDEVTSPIESGGSGIDQSKIGIVVNQSAPDLGIDQNLLQYAAAGAELLVAIPLDSGAVIAASNHNRLSDIILLHDQISPAYYSIVQQLLPNEKLVAPLNDGNGNAGSQIAAPSQPTTPVGTDNKKKRKNRLFG
jgi:septum formation inhibitor-activating ATPase MinD